MTNLESISHIWVVCSTPLLHGEAYIALERADLSSEKKGEKWPKLHTKGIRKGFLQSLPNRVDRYLRPTEWGPLFSTGKKPGESERATYFHRLKNVAF